MLCWSLSYRTQDDYGVFKNYSYYCLCDCYRFCSLFGLLKHNHRGKQLLVRLAFQEKTD